MNHEPHAGIKGWPRWFCGLLVAWLAVRCVWHGLDNTPLRGDQNFYVIGAVNILSSLSLPWAEFFFSLNDVTETKIRPPGNSLLLAPWLALFENNLQWVRAVTVFWLALAFFSCYAFARKFTVPALGLYAGVLLISQSLIYDVSIDPEAHFIGLVPLALLLCARFFERSPWTPGYWLGFGLVTALGLLMKWVFAIYLLGPLVLMSWRLGEELRQGKTAREWLRLGLHILLMLLPVLLAALWWYWPNLPLLLHEFQKIAELKQFTPFKAGWTWQVPLIYPQVFFDHNKLWPSVLTAFGVILVLLPNRLLIAFGLRPFSSAQRRGGNLLLSSVIGFWLYFTVRYENVPPKYLFGLLPVLSLLGVWGVNQLRWNWLRHSLLAWLLLYGLACTVWLHFAPLSWLGPSNLPRVLHLTEAMVFRQWLAPVPSPPQTACWPQEAIARAIAAHERSNLDSELITVLPDLYYFDWRSLRMHLRLLAPNMDCKPFDARRGLQTAYQAKYLVSARGRISRHTYAMRQQNPIQKSSQALARLIDRAPQWFWKHYELIGKFALPYGMDEIHLYKRIQPHDAHSTTQWANFWMGFHLDDPLAWEQIRNLWRSLRDQEKARRAQQIGALVSRANKTNALPHGLTAQPLLPYEALQVGAWLLAHDDISSAMPLLTEGVQETPITRWKGRLVLAQWWNHRRTPLRDDWLIEAWRAMPERPEPLFALRRLYRRQNREAQAQAFGKIAQHVIGILNHNRRPDLYREVSAELLPFAPFQQDALWYAQQAFLVGLNVYPNTIQLVEAQRKLERLTSDFERLDLSTISNAYEHTALQQNQSHVFAFLNTEAGTHALRWEHRQNAEKTILQFELDGRTLGRKTFTPEQNGRTAEFILVTPAWQDRLRVRCLQGDLEMKRPRLVKRRKPAPLVNWQNQPNLHSRDFKRLSAPKRTPARFAVDQATGSLFWLTHTDPRAWDRFAIEGGGLPTGPLRLTFSVRNAVERVTKEIKAQSAIVRQSSSSRYQITLPSVVKQFPFLLGIRFHLERLDQGNEIIIQSGEFWRTGHASPPR